MARPVHPVIISAVPCGQVGAAAAVSFDGHAPGVSHAFMHPSLAWVGDPEYRCRGVHRLVTKDDDLMADGEEKPLVLLVHRPTPSSKSINAVAATIERDQPIHRSVIIQLTGWHSKA